MGSRDNAREAAKTGGMRQHALALIGVLAVGYVVRYLGQVAIARTLGVRLYGCWRLGLAVAVVASVAVSFGYPSLLVRVLARNKKEGAPLVREAVLVAGILFGLLSAVVVGWSLWSGPEKALCVEALWGATLGFALLRIGSGIWRGLGRFGVATTPGEIVRPVVEVGSVLVAVSMGTSWLGTGMLYGVAITFVGLLVVVWGWRECRRSEDRPTTAPVTGTWVRIAVGLVVVDVVNSLMTRVDLLSLGIWSDPESVGRYSAGAQIASLVGVPYMILRLAIGPAVSSAYAEDRLRVLIRHLRRYLLYMFVLELVLGAAAVWYWEVLCGLFGQGFVASSGSYVLGILVATQVTMVAIGPVGTILALTRLEKEAALLNVVGLAANVLLNAALIPRLGALGAALGTLVATLSWRTGGAILIRRRLGVTSHVLH